MSVFDTMAWAKNQRTGNVGRKAVLMALAERTGDEPVCFPSQARLANETEQGERTVRRQLAELEEDGFITSSRRYVDSYGKPLPRGKACNQYRLNVTDQPANLAGGADDQPANGARPTGQSVADEVPVVEEPSLNNQKHAEADAPAALFEAPKPKPKGKKPAKPLTGVALVADELARAEWERRPIKPVCGFVPLRLRIGEALEAGHTREAIAAVLPTMPVFSRNSFDLALSSRSAKRTPRPVDDDRARPSGKVTL